LTFETGPIEVLEARIGWSFRDRDLFLRALTHASYANEHPPERDNEGLAFLGDAVLGLVVAERLWETAGDQPVGVLTPRRATLVAGETLARWARELELGTLLRLGKGEELTGGRQRESVLATALEAILGVIYLEGGLSAVRGVVAPLAMW
jgi:ribonuclease-3